MGAASAALALAWILTAPLFEDRVTLTADYTSAWAPGRYANAAGRVSLVGRRSALDKLRAPLALPAARLALRSALDASLLEAGPMIASAAPVGPPWAAKTLDRCSAAIESALGGRWKASSPDLAASASADPPGPESPG